jgi:hypothetical protein
MEAAAAKFVKDGRGKRPKVYIHGGATRPTAAYGRE